MRQLSVKILENKKIARDFYKMRIESAYLAKNIKPGQFLEVRCSDGSDPLLRRPLGAHRILKDSVEMLYEVVGRGTALLSKKKAGTHLDIIGPLGNGFDINRTPNPDPRSPIIICGGIGAAPLVALAEKMAHNSKLKTQNKKGIDVIIGAKTKSHILCEAEFRSLGCAVSVVTEDGSKGRKGLATDLLKN
ncbi:MAG: dihydroorotate dehydrogenase electron transfer subunit, partial [Candidatus Omnitrophica bacterium]|nr:dihydroorotate dehydrogenase electron transfer subunit [Candidatus Omnitrophota bacterium]